MKTSGGCYTKYEAVKETISIKVASEAYDDEREQWNCWGICYLCGEVWLGADIRLNDYTTHTHTLGNYYLLSCGKTTDTIETATIIY